ncbi:MAG: sigma 54-interacting transcriptional regulator [Gammaproteobacteria bacterium]|nr:sigma 54-interacting transcriptional regulator [Gammaproteobacteria bacterium]
MKNNEILPDPAFLQSLVDAHQEPFCLVDEQYRIVAANQRYAEVYAGMDKNAVVGRKCHEISHDSDEPCDVHEECPLRQTFDQGHAFQVVHRHYDQYHEPDYVTVAATPIFNAAGTVVLMGESMHSISHGEDLCFDAERMVSGCCPSFMRVLDNLVTVAETEFPVLVLGETGSGKEMAAQLIHRKSRRAEREFVTIDCTQFTEERFASELFGHIRGAFTGAVENKLGLFELADRGTLFLDEIGELPLTAQAKLLRTLETGKFRRLGETRERQADVRLVCATNRDIQHMVRNGEFRADLYYRINCMQVELPPLRHRKGDLPELVDYFLARAGHRPGISEVAYETLLAYPFPGNMRELRNILDRAVALARGAQIEVAHLPPEVTHPERAPAIHPVHADRDFVACDEHEISEADHLREVLHKHRGNRRLAAQELGITERTLYRRLKAHSVV